MKGLLCPKLTTLPLCTTIGAKPANERKAVTPREAAVVATLVTSAAAMTAVYGRTGSSLRSKEIGGLAPVAIGAERPKTTLCNRLTYRAMDMREKST